VKKRKNKVCKEQERRTKVETKTKESGQFNIVMSIPKGRFVIDLGFLLFLLPLFILMETILFIS